MSQVCFKQIVGGVGLGVAGAYLAVNQHLRLFGVVGELPVIR